MEFLSTHESQAKNINSKTIYSFMFPFMHLRSVFMASYSRTFREI